MAVGAVLDGIVSVSLTNETAESSKRAEKHAEDKIEQEEKPFTSRIHYETLPDDVAWKIVLDRPLSEQEQEELQVKWGTSETGTQEAIRFLISLGGRMIAYPPDDYEDQNADITIFKMNLFSTRTTHLSITSMRPINVSCHKPTAETVVAFPPPLSFSRSCKRAAGLRAWHGWSPLSRR